MFRESDCQHEEDTCSVVLDLQLGMLFLFKKQRTFSCLLLDASLNISTSHFTSTPSAFEVILQLTSYINYLLTYSA